MNKPDIIFLADRIDTFVDLVQNPQGYFKRNKDAILPESLDLKIIAAALYLLGDCYFRGKGLSLHPRSKTREIAMEALAATMNAIHKEVEARPYLYPKLSGVFGRGEAAVEFDLLLNGYSKWQEEK